MTYPAATLNYLSKKKKWYVYVTIPPDLRDAFKGKTQLRRSTGTADEREARRRLHGIAAEIYQEFGKPLKDELESLSSFVVGADMRGTVTDKEASDPVERRQLLQWLLDQANAQANAKVDRDDHEAMALKDIMKDDVAPHLKTLLGDNADEVTFASVAQDFLQQTSFPRQQLKKQAEFVVKEFVAFLKGKALAEITPVTLYAYAQQLSDDGAAYNTIRGRIDKISLVFHHAVRKGIVPVNPCLGLKLQGYGKPRESYKPLTDEEVAQLFTVPMPDQHRLLFKCLTLTGARLDEIALLTWDEVETIRLPDGTEATFVNLTKRPSLKKNKRSLRHIPLHPSIKLPDRGNPQDRLFDCFGINEDGKTISASETMVAHIRKVTTDDLKVVHSLRHTFKDKLRDVGVPKEINDFITGHGSGDVAGKYGAGPSLAVRYDAILRLDVPWSD